MTLNITNKMSSSELKKAVQDTRQYLNDDERINPDIKDILFSVLNYVEDNLCGMISSYIKDANRYHQVNEIFRLGIESSKSLENEKKFYADVQMLLGSISNEKSKLRDTCLPILMRNEAKLMHDLEQNDPSHRNAVNGIISASVGLGFMFSLVSRNPYWFVMSLFVFVGKLTPATLYSSSPSLLGQLAYIDPTVRQWGNRLNLAAPVNFGYRMLNLFSKSTNAALNIAEKTVDRIDRIAGSQNHARYGLLDQNSQNRLQITNESEEDTSYAARRLR